MGKGPMWGFRHYYDIGFPTAMRGAERQWDGIVEFLNKIGSETALVQISAQPLMSCVTTVKLLNLTGSQFPCL